MSPSDPTLYEVLGLPRSASAAEIKAAYRKAARNAHPDQGGSSERFHRVTEAYRILGDPQSKAVYDRKLNPGGPGTDAGTAGTPGTTGGRTAAGPAGRAAGTRSAPERTAADLDRPPVFVPDFSPQNPPLIPLALAGTQIHGTPRRPGFFSRIGSNTAGRFDAENRTIRLLDRELLPEYPAARLVNGLHIPDAGPRGGNLDVGHVLLGGYRMAVLGSLMASPGNYRWDGRHLLHRGRETSTLRLADAVRTLQSRFPECNVTGWLVLHSPNGNPFEPIVDYPPNLSRSAPATLHAANPGGLLRELRRFFAEGPQPNTVQLPVLAPLIDASSR
ncbi:J domain-containing protein [Arthrobacter sp. zg-Y769]|uniref:J domain-containing protein n=1 Tax=Arthrobacter sp. zg-Y769 TaxID=2894191 RepID=UPI001E3A5B65|nr:J domain-containing protein [Arthrobacter sp. zg-Y769]MCC9203628.1 J domain-containing protein [Arthrobacter sp. zg-Y769]